MKRAPARGQSLSETPIAMQTAVSGPATSAGPRPTSRPTPAGSIPR